MPEVDDPLEVRPVRGLRGAVSVPGDKSISHRALILGALAEGSTRVRNLSPGEDVTSTREALRALGVSIEEQPDGLLLEGRGGAPLVEPDDVLDVGNSGTSMRLLAGVLAAQPIFSVLTGDDSLRRRPMDRVARPLRRMGAEIWGREDGRFAPLAIRGGDLHPIHYDLPVASAQVKTSILLAGLRLQGETSVREPHPSRDHTERMLRHLGARIEAGPGWVRLQGGGPLRGGEIEVPGDLSSAAFLVVTALVTPSSELEIRGVGMNPSRTGFLQILRRMGASVEITERGEAWGEPVGDLRVLSSRLRGTTIEPAEIPGSIDEIPVLCVAAAFADGVTTIQGAAELRVKESDRLAAMADGLRKMGVEVSEKADGLEIVGRGRVEPFEGDSHRDHRVAMSLIVAALGAEGPCRISGAGCMSISFPNFMEVLGPVVVE